MDIDTGTLSNNSPKKKKYLFAFYSNIHYQIFLFHYEAATEMQVSLKSSELYSFDKHALYIVSLIRQTKTSFEKNCFSAWASTLNMGLINKVDMVCLSPVGYGV